jgi:hypothetical protein
MKLYVVKNKAGKFFRAKGYNGGGESWVDSLDKAKFYTKIGQAKSRVTYFYRSDPSYGCPDILEFEIDESNAKIIDMLAETEKKNKKEKERKLKLQEQRLEDQKNHLLKEQERINQQLKNLQ